MVSSFVPAPVVAVLSCVPVVPKGVIVSPSDLPLAFRRQHRLLKPAEFANVFAARRVLRGTQFALHYRDTNLPTARLGLVIPKKQARTAVLRNAIKRQAREVFRLRLAGLPARDIVLRLDRSVEVQDRPAWRDEIIQLLERLGRT